MRRWTNLGQSKDLGEENGDSDGRLMKHPHGPPQFYGGNFRYVEWNQDRVNTWGCVCMGEWKYGQHQNVNIKYAQLEEY